MGMGMGVYGKVLREYEQKRRRELHWWVKLNLMDGRNFLYNKKNEKLPPRFFTRY